MHEEPPITVLLADDHGVLRAGLRMLLENQPEMTVIGEAGDGITALRLTQELSPDVLLLDISMPGMDGLQALLAIRVAAPDCRVLLLTMHEEEAILRQALQAGAAGYVLKKSAETELLSAIRAVARSEAFVDPGMTKVMIECYLGLPPDSAAARFEAESLTPREVEVLQLVAAGYTNREVAEKLVISVKTVETHKAHITGRLGVKSRVEWLRYARANGLLSTD
jgi:two-component system response regulator NreC